VRQRGRASSRPKRAERGGSVPFGASRPDGSRFAAKKSPARKRRVRLSALPERLRTGPALSRTLQVVSSIVERRECESCGAEISAFAGRDRRYCDATCRASAAKRRRRVERRASYSTPVLSELERVLAAATSEERLLAHVARAAGTGNWRASAWILERRFPERWGPPPRSTQPAPSPLDDLVTPSPR
jgi:hypothetical protein